MQLVIDIKNAYNKYLGLLVYFSLAQAFDYNFKRQDIIFLST